VQCAHAGQAAAQDAVTAAPLRVLAARGPR
jgi:hypothetical protein